MTDLLELQEQFQHFILKGQSNIENSIVATEDVSVDTRLGIYREGYQLRLIECLTSNFPALHLYLGTEEFEKMCTAYINGHPSSYRSIRWYGDCLAEFLKNYYDKPYSFLAELADFEWKMTLAFDAADEERVRVEDMATVPAEAWAGLQFTMHQSLQRMDYCWNTIPLWQSLLNNQDLPELEQSPHAAAWILWRTLDYLNHFYSLTEAEAWALDAVIQGLSFGELCEGLCHWIEPEQVAMQAASFLKGWIEKGMIVGLLIQ